MKRLHSTTLLQWQ